MAKIVTVNYGIWRSLVARPLWERKVKSSSLFIPTNSQRQKRITMPTIKIIKTDSGDVVETMGAESMRSAEKIESGININLNHDEYHTEITD